MSFISHRQSGYLAALHDLREWIKSHDFDCPEEERGASIVAEKAYEMADKILSDAEKLAAATLETL